MRIIDSSARIGRSSAAPFWPSLLVGVALWGQPCPSFSFDNKSNIEAYHVGIGSTVSHDTATEDYKESILFTGDRVRYNFRAVGNVSILFSLDIAPDGSALMQMERKGVGSEGDLSIHVNFAAALAVGRYQAIYFPGGPGGSAKEWRDEPIGIGGPAVEFHGTSTKVEIGQGNSLMVKFASDSGSIDFDLALSQADGFGFVKLSRSFSG